jgi:prepilin-type N-terminal cleavage/methylation domain-containing protein
MKLPHPSPSLGALRPSAGQRGHRAGFSIVEVLIAMAIALTFLSALYTSFIQLMRASDQMRARVEAMRHGRAAMLTLTDEFRAISRSGADYLLVGVSEKLTHGDGRDNDDDGSIDEESVTGRDDDGDYNALNDDNHAFISTPFVGLDVFERFNFLLVDDLGDFKVDEDVVFGNDTLQFQLFPPAIDASLTSATISYGLGALDGRSHVLLRTAKVEDGSGTTTTMAPLAFGVLGLDLLYWDPNRDHSALDPHDRPYWFTDWDSRDAGSFNAPQLPLPASIYMRLTLYADRRPLASYQPGEPVDTLILQTVVNLEDIIGDAVYPRPSL